MKVLTEIGNRVNTHATVLSNGVANAEQGKLPGLIYHPEGDAIVVRNGTRWDMVWAR